jgi:hypothetical protein
VPALSLRDRLFKLQKKLARGGLPMVASGEHMDLAARPNSISASARYSTLPADPTKFRQLAYGGDVITALAFVAPKRRSIAPKSRQSPHTVAGGRPGANSFRLAATLSTAWPLSLREFRAYGIGRSISQSSTYMVSV